MILKDTGEKDIMSRIKSKNNPSLLHKSWQIKEYREQFLAKQKEIDACEAQ